MKQDITKVIMNPIRQRILQFLILNKTGTAGEIGGELKDVPTASLYRHIKVLYEAGCILVVEEKKVRGTIERKYALADNMATGKDNADAEALIQATFLSLMSSFQRYFQKEDINPQKDMLSLGTSTLLLSDEECMDFFQKIGTIIGEAMSNKPNEVRKPRRITLISSPCEEE